jgi:hypothetical protein
VSEDKKNQSPEPETNQTRKKVDLILKGNFNNLAKKVMDGKTLTAGEIAILKEQAGDAGGEILAKKEFAKNQRELADILGVSRWTIQRLIKLPDAPRTRPNGTLNIAEWRAFLEKHDLIEGNTHDEDLNPTALKARQILLQNEKLEHQLAVMRGEFVASADVQQSTAAMIANAKRVLLRGPSALAPQVVGVSIAEAEILLREWLHDALNELCNDPLGRNQSPETEAAHAT